MTDKAVSVLLFIVGVINVLPAAVFFDSSKTSKLYGVPIEGDSLLILIRHRGVLLAIIGLMLIASAFKPEFRVLAVVLALVSKFAFIFLTFTAAGYTPEVKQIALIDAGAIALLLIALGIHFYGK